MRELAFIRSLGSGAVGTVYLADMVSGQGFRRQVAVKVLMGSQPGAEQFISRMRDEARLLGLLQDERILEVSELVRVADRDAVIMEFVEGINLLELVERGMSTPPRALAEIGAMVAGALHKAHTATHPVSREPLNVIHRDVKPANIMVTVRGSVKLLDFGVARAHFEARESFTGQLVLGTLNYMAPEYIVTGEVTPAADIYGLGIALYESASGKIFGQPRIRRKRFEAAVSEALESIRESHGELLAILERMLVWAPEQRPSGSELEHDLMVAADELRGSSLRSWAASQIGPMLEARRGQGEDPVDLVGRTHPIESEPEEKSNTTTPFPIGHGGDADNAEPPLELSSGSDAAGAADEASTPAPPPDETEKPLELADRVEHPVTPPPAKRPPSPAPARPAPPPASERTPPAPSSNLGLAIKSLLVGAGIGFILVVIAALLVLGH